MPSAAPWRLVTAILRGKRQILTASLWVLVAAGISLSYAFARETEGFPRLARSVLWAPWVLTGILGMHLVWRNSRGSHCRGEDDAEERAGA